MTNEQDEECKYKQCFVDILCVDADRYNHEKMEKYKQWERQGIIDLFNSEPLDDIVFAIAKTVTKSLMEPQTKAGKCMEHYVAIVLCPYTFN